MAAMSLSTAGLGLSSRTLSNNVVSLRQPAAAPARVQHAGFCVQAASKKKDVRLTITLECTEQKASGVQGMSRYTTEKNRRNTSARLELMKYNRYMRKHTLHRELKK